MAFLRLLHEAGAILGYFLRLMTLEKRRFSNRNAPDDTFLIRRAPSGESAIFPALDRKTVSFAQR